VVPDSILVAGMANARSRLLGSWASIITDSDSPHMNIGTHQPFPDSSHITYSSAHNPEWAV
jgi:hypothetical protein